MGIEDCLRLSSDTGDYSIKGEVELIVSESLSPGSCSHRMPWFLQQKPSEIIFMTEA